MMMEALDNCNNRPTSRAAIDSAGTPDPVGKTTERCGRAVDNSAGPVIHSFLSCAQQAHELLPILTDAAIGGDELARDAARVKHRRVVAAAERVADLGQRMLGELLRERHRHL